VRRALLLIIWLWLGVGCGKSAEAILDSLPEAPAADAGGGTNGTTSITARPPPPAAFPHVHLTLTLRSSPPGAAAAVDGRPVGQTPVIYALDSDGRPHEFTFVMPGYAPWRVRFPPVKDGVIHATLRPVTFGDAGP
jgi:hypothetical protein